MSFSTEKFYKDYIAGKKFYDFDRNIIEYPSFPIYCDKCHGFVYAITCNQTREILTIGMKRQDLIPKIEFKCEKCNETWSSIEVIEKEGKLVRCKLMK